MLQKTHFTNNDCEEKHYGHQAEKGIDNCSDHDRAPVYNNSPASVALIPIAERSATRISKSAISIATSLHISCLPHRGPGEQGRKPILIESASKRSENLSHYQILQVHPMTEPAMSKQLIHLWKGGRLIVRVRGYPHAL